MTKILKAFLTASLLGAGLTSMAGQAATLNVPCTTGTGFKQCEALAQAWAESSGNSVKIVTVPFSSSDKLALYQQILSSQSADLDVFDVDVVWPGILGAHFADLAPYTQGVEQAHFQSIIANNHYKGKLVAMPAYTDAPVLYYRKDLLEKYGEPVPITWQEMTDSAKRIQEQERAAGNDKMWGYVFQGKAYEGLTCDALEWIDSFGGGTLVEFDGEISVNNPKSAAALDLAASWVGSITPQGVLNYDEEGARRVFQSGNAVFMRNWPYAWALANGDESVIKNKVGIVPLPMGPNGQHSATLGGWQYAVSKYSENVEAAADYVMYVTSAAAQKQNALLNGYLPTIVSLYEDEEVLAANPFFAYMRATLEESVARPSTVTGEKYNQVSNEFWNAAHRVLSGKSSGAESVAELERKLKRIRGRRW
ncbi:ABC transporter substrate-binding protein [Marinobacterium sp. D7]|uniref:ABC transporter substrate-binding protein n=1 Tax=Marinobacterium ramblicola TaxID=2849041 RepID=UPI001C2D146B|nr:ABC transporter substrate-binding protein [Marinobacterium ramblicola]MBV1787676.1 ABC transporter substrate-binding protein [Marinobacterium ramblicola]